MNQMLSRHNGFGKLLGILTTIFLLSQSSLASAYTPSCSLLPARSASTGGEVFLGGDFIELGLSDVGSWGTEGDAPDGFRGNDSENAIGMSADLDGYCSNPSDNTDLPIDFFLPGSPEERWGVGFTLSGNQYYGSFSALNGDDYSPGISAEHTVTDETSGTNLQAKVVSIISLNDEGVLRVTAVHRFQKTAAYFTTSVVFENISGSILTDVRYHRSFDPDNAKFQNGDYDTRLSILGTFAESGANIVEARLANLDVTNLAQPGEILAELQTTSGIETEIPILYYSAEANSVVYIGGFSNYNTYQPVPGDVTDFYVDPQPLNYQEEDDIAMGIILSAESLGSSQQSETLTYVTSLDARDFEEIETELSDVVASVDAPLVEVRADKIPEFDQKGTVLGSSGGTLTLTGFRLYCTTEVRVNGISTNFSHLTSAVGDGRAELRIVLPELQPGFHQISMNSCGGSVVYERFLYIPKTPVAFEGKVSNGFERALMMLALQSWAREHRLDFNAVECVINTKALTSENATLLAQDMCSKVFGLLGSPRSQSTVVRENSTHSAIWYRVTLSNR